ncbi:MAG TPA: glycosyltransferase family 1 protein [Thermoanaerobaculia bacterium]|nr:glycosyltransferase family 1 protein [Thermoanaerobaculia bacterium]
MRIGIDARKMRDYGIGTYIRGLMAGLSECRGDEEYVIFGPENARPAVLPDGFRYHAVEAPHYSIRELFVMGRAIARADLDVFHAPHYVVPFTPCPTVVTIHDLIHLHVRHRNPLAALYARTMLWRAVRRSRRVITVSETVKREIEAAFPGAAVTVTPNGVGAPFRPSLRTSPGPSYFLYVGNDKPHKNVERTVEEFGLLRGEKPKVSLLLVGAPFERFHATPGVIAPGFLETDELAALYRHAVALVQPSREEGFGLPALEAMASGTAVITSTHPALVEVTGDAALHVDVESAGALAAAMRELMDDSTRRDALAQRGMERAKEFTWKRCAELTRQVYLAARA